MAKLDYKALRAALIIIGLTAGNYIRGRGFYGTQLGRLAWALGTFGAGMALGNEWYWASAAGAGAFIGMLKSHGSYFKFGYPPENTKTWLDWLVGSDTSSWWRSFWAMLIIGTARTTLMLAPLQLWIIIPIGSLLYPLCYAAAWAWRGENNDAIKWAEILYGCSLAIACSFTLL